MPVVDLCVWIDQIEETNANSTQYMVYAASLIHESNVSIWLRFTFRCFVSIYVLYRLWTNYYAHYRPLLTNLSSLGLSKDYRRYEIVLGDPAYAILSDPVVSFVMVLDIWWSVSYVTIAVIRVSQLQDIIVNINGYPGLLAILAYIYCGPIIALFGTTRLVFIYYVLWNIGLSSDLHGHGVEAITGTIYI
ncbi:unnamed protein product [Aphanomyces euteiches]